MRVNGSFRYALQARDVTGTWRTVASRDDQELFSQTLDEGARRGTSLHWRILDQLTDTVVKEVEPNVQTLRGRP